MLRTQLAIGALAFALSLAWLSDARGNLGDTLAEAEAHGKAYQAQFGAVAPLFNTDANGRVLWECWAAPPEQWTKDEAMELARRLIPKEIASQSPQVSGLDGTGESFTYPDGTIVILQFANLDIKGVNGPYYGVEVRSPRYTGPYC